MSNSNKNNLEDAAESDPKLNEDAKQSKFNKTKSISEVFSKLELSEDLDEDSVDDIVLAHDDSDEIIPIHNDLDEVPVHDEVEEVDEIIPVHDEVEEVDEIIPVHDDLDEVPIYDESEGDDDIIQIRDEEDEIIPIHNEYGEDDAYSNEISEGGLVLNPVDYEGPQEESDSDKENSDDSLNLESENDDDEAISDEIAPELFENDDIGEDGLDHALDDEKLESAKPSSQGVIINSNAEDEGDSKFLNSSFIFTGIGFVIGLLIFIYGLIYYTTASDRVVDNVLSGETAGMAVMIIIIGLIIIAFSALSFISSRKSLKFMDAFNDIRSIDYDEIKNDTFSREDFESAFTNVFKRNNEENEDDMTPVNDESEGSADASIGSLLGSLRKERSSKSQVDENPKSSSSNKFKSADDFDSYIEPIHTESSAQDTIFNDSDTQDESIDDSDADFDDSVLDDSSSLSESSVESELVGDIKSRVVDEDAAFEVFVPDSDSDALDVDAIKADSIHKFKKSLNLDDILDDGGDDGKSSELENVDEENI